MTIDALSRRHCLHLCLGALAAALPFRAEAAERAPIARVIIDNDFSGDPDGLFQLAQAVLSPSIDIPLIIGSHLPANSPWVTSQTTASEAAAKARELLGVMKRSDPHRVLAGAERAIPARSDWRPSPASAAIVAEAMRTDRTAPLAYTAGAGLTEIALAWLAEPRIGKRMKLIWIGGEEHPDLAYPPPGPRETEFNVSIDPLAAQIIFNESDIEIWQVPRNVYRQMLFSYAELRALAKSGPLGRYLKGEIDRIDAMVGSLPGAAGFPRSETYILGDSPLVTLTALQSFFQPDPTSSMYRRVPTPRLNERGEYTANPAGRPMRVYMSIDTRLTFEDMLAKFREADGG